MRLTTPLALMAFVAACGGGSDQEASPTGTTTASTTTTAAAAVPSLDERAQLFDYDESAPLNKVEKKAKSEKGAEVVDVVFEAADRKVSAFLVRPKGKPNAAVLWAHWYGEEPNTNRTEFLPDAIALAQDGVASLLRKDCSRGRSRSARTPRRIGS